MNIILKFIFLFFITFNICLSNNFIDKNILFINNGTYVPLFKESNNKNILRYVNSFFIDKYSVNNLNFLKFVLNNPFWDFNNAKSIFCDDEYLSHWRVTNDFNDIVYMSIVNVSWFSASSYCEFLSCRLPCIDEWEYAAVFEKQSLLKDSEFKNSNNILNWYIRFKSPDSFNIYNMPCNTSGICGMHGFIWEWVQDFSSVILINTDAEGGGLEELLYCGATTINAIDPSDYVAFMRFSFRNTLEANYSMSKLGFRCVKDVN